MSEIPPNISSSAAQAGFTQADAAKARDAERSGSGLAARRGVQSIDDAGSTIETSDEDTAVFSDAEGAGGQGRSDAEEESDETQTSDSQENDSSSGISSDPDGTTHLDISA